jgi:integrase
MQEQDRHSLRDGRIIIYKRAGSPLYQMRLNLHGMRGYFRRSTKSSSLPEALRTADETYDDLRYKIKHGLEIKLHTFESIWVKWQAVHRNYLSIHRMRYISGTVNRYLLPFFGELKPEELTSAKVQSYWSWRMDYWSSAEGMSKIENAQKSRTTQKRPYKQKLGNVAKVPSQKTLQMEQSVLRQILRWANNFGLIDRLPEIKAPRLQKNMGVSRRPAFDPYVQQG